ncbi:hypothetical protein FQN60_001242 [Etheostoma spectabile]|uniref:Uncharacterized protein n=1 Tax=Etheostoma spectabile TaxID=54343 RepID=A0A5J5CZT8_9PERO|nr:hypothetical protein FQN60_001242 [Etheostoma spectabile]
MAARSIKYGGRGMTCILSFIASFFRPPLGFQSAKTYLVLVELSHTEVPLLLSHLRPSIC